MRIEIILQNMSLPLANVLTPLTPSCLDVLKESNTMLVKHSFQIALSPDLRETVLMGVTDNFIIVSSNQEGYENHFFCPLDFDLKFQILRRQWPDAKTPGVPFGIRFQRGSQNNSFQIYNSNAAVVADWGSLLSKKINQRNFHQLFKAKKKIGKGAFASVYLAERLTDKKMVAVKAFSKEKQFTGEKGKQSLENQIRLMRAIDHPNITKLEEVYETQNSIYVILECLKGKQLNEVIKSGRKFTNEQISSMIGQILSGLAHLAHRRIIHRDLKPENIMFKNQQSIELSICDFGLATNADAQKYLFVRCGTPGYVAPEIINIRDMQTKSHPISDVFSAGVIFHLLLLGFSIFPGKKYNEVLTQNRSCEFNFNKPQYSALNPITLNLLMLMLEKNPTDRVHAEAALKHDFFGRNTGMDIQEPERKPLQELNFVRVPKPVRHHLSQHQSSQMEDQNANSFRTTCIGHSVKKKFSFLSNESCVQKVPRESFKKY